MNDNTTCTNFFEEYKKADMCYNCKTKPKYFDELSELHGWIDNLNKNLDLQNAYKSYIQDNAVISCEKTSKCSSKTEFKDCSEQNVRNLLGAVKVMQLFPDHHPCIMNSIMKNPTLYFKENKCKITLKKKDKALDS